MKLNTTRYQEICSYLFTKGWRICSWPPMWYKDTPVQCSTKTAYMLEAQNDTNIL